MNRSKKNAENGDDGAGDNAVLDTLLEKLRNGDSVGRKSRKNRRPNGSNAPPLPDISTIKGPHDVNFEPTLPEAGDKTVDLARDMLAALKSDGFEAFTPTTSSRPDRTSRRSRQRRRVVSEFGAEEPIASPTFSDDRELSGVEEGDTESEMSPRPGTPSDGGDFNAAQNGDGDATIRQR